MSLYDVGTTSIDRQTNQCVFMCTNSTERMWEYVSVVCVCVCVTNSIHNYYDHALWLVKWPTILEEMIFHFHQLKRYEMITYTHSLTRVRMSMWARVQRLTRTHIISRLTHWNWVCVWPQINKHFVDCNSKRVTNRFTLAFDWVYLSIYLSLYVRICDVYINVRSCSQWSAHALAFIWIDQIETR